MFAVYDPTTQSVTLLPSGPLIDNGSLSGAMMMGGVPSQGQGFTVLQQGLPHHHGAAMQAWRSGEVNGSPSGALYHNYTESGNDGTGSLRGSVHASRGLQKTYPGRAWDSMHMVASDSKEKNRLAQKRFRARQKGTISQMEQQVQEMLAQAAHSERLVQSLREENTALKLQLNRQLSQPTGAHSQPGVTHSRPGVAHSQQLIRPVAAPQQIHRVASADSSPQDNTSPAHSVHNSDVSSWTPQQQQQQQQQGGLN